MRVLFFGNNRVACEILPWLREQGEEIVGLVIHPQHRQKYATELVAASGVEPERIFDGSQLREAEIRAAIRVLEPQIGISAFFGYILDPAILKLMPAGCLNVHPSFLPYNRGAHPNVWSIVDGTPAGVTLHYMDEGVDSGDIVAQREVVVEPIDTGETLYRKLETTCLELFCDTWPLIRSGHAPRTPQHSSAGTYHRIRDVERIDEIRLDNIYTAREVIDIIRARSFPPYAGAYFRSQGRKVHLRLQLCYEEDAGHGTCETNSDRKPKGRPGLSCLPDCGDVGQS